MEVTCRLLRDLPSPCADKKPRSTWDIGVSMQILNCSDVFSFETKISMMKLPGKAAATTGLTARPSTVPALVRLCSGIIHKQTKNYSKKAQEKPAKFVCLQTWQFVANPTKNQIYTKE